jgi:tRNA A-37 threonylcarbamoyl transferase component Bud32/predicted nucleotidyltransferase
MNLQRLSPEASQSLLEVAEDVVGRRGKVLAVAAYGSKVAGYAKADSDYDIIVVAKKFRGKIKYEYVDSPVTASALVVEEELLQRDAVRASLGEFVSGRLLNVYEPLLNGDLIRKAELESKKRVLAEEILEIGSQHGEFAQDLLIPLEYFLFDKLHKRAFVYPPALYSYVRTYSCSYGDENKAFALEGFAEAALSLQASGVLKVETRKEGGAPYIRILGEGLRSRAFARILSLFNLTTRGVKQYAVHGYAGRVGFNVFKDEAVSKLRRMQDRIDPPPELAEPKRLIGLEEGFILPKTEQMVERLAALSGFATYTKREKNLGEFYSTAKLLTLRNAGGNETRFVFKHFADIRSVKWALLNVWSLSRKFSTSPQARMHREYLASIGLRSRGVATPKIVGAVLDDRVLVKEYIVGRRLSDLVQDVLTGRSGGTEIVERFGEAMGAIHKAGFAVGDPKATNVIVKEKTADLYFTDLEQAMEGGDQAWDVAGFVYYQAKLSFREEGMKKVAEAFLKGYTKANGNENIAKALSPKYIAPFRPLTAPQVLRIVRESLDANSIEGPKEATQ